MADARTVLVRARFPGQPSSVTAARRLLRTHVGTLLRDEDLDTAELLVSELVTNTVVHAGTPIELVVSVLGGTTCRVEVFDGSVQRPTRRRHAVLASTGRGLHLLDELADRWGVTVGDAGKAVWFQLAAVGRPATGTLEDARRAGHAADQQPVQGERARHTAAGDDERLDLGRERERSQRDSQPDQDQAPAS